MNYNTGYNSALHCAGLLKKQAAPTNYAQDFAAGVDPFGLWTNAYGRRNENAGISDGEHTKKRVLSTLGGTLGGAALIPSAISGLSQGFNAAALAPRSRMSAGVKGLAAGAMHPFKAVISGRRASKALAGVGSGAQAEFAAKDLASISDFADNIPLSVFRQGGEAPLARGRAPAKGAIDSPLASFSISDLQKLRQRAQDVSAGSVPRGLIDPETRRAAAAAAPHVRAGTNTAIAQMGMGGGVGALGAYAQYGAGRQTERETTIEARLRQKAQDSRQHPFREQ